MFSVPNSLVFLLILRQTLSEFVEFSDLKKKEKVSLQSYFMNEASDYEVMHFFLKEEFSKKKYNEVEEEKLFDEFKTIIIENFSTLSKDIDGDILKSIIFEITPIGKSGLSSAIPVLEFLLSNPHTMQLIEQKKWSLGMVRKTVKKQLGRAKDVMRPTTFTGKGGKPSWIRKAGEGKPGKLTKAGKIATAAAIVALATYAGYRIWRDKLSAAAKACASQPDKWEKDKCMKKYKEDALKARVAALKSGISQCSKSSNPEACKASIGKKIKSLSK